jgi:hypothetical protein
MIGMRIMNHNRIMNYNRIMNHNRMLNHDLTHSLVLQTVNRSYKIAECLTTTDAEPTGQSFVKLPSNKKKRLFLRER